MDPISTAIIVFTACFLLGGILAAMAASASTSRQKLGLSLIFIPDDDWHTKNLARMKRLGRLQTILFYGGLVVGLVLAGLVLYFNWSIPLEF
jgi:hypothetical protein